MARPALQVDLTGPLFQRDPKKTLRDNIHRLVEGMAEEGERLARSAWPVLTGAGQRGTQATVFYLVAFVNATHEYPWPNGGQKRYRGGKVERRVGMFRRTTTALRRSRAAATADLTEGLN